MKSSSGPVASKRPTAFRYDASAAARALFSSCDVAPSDSSGSAKTRARRISSSLGHFENRTVVGTGVTFGTVRFTVTAGGGGSVDPGDALDRSEVAAARTAPCAEAGTAVATTSA